MQRQSRPAAIWEAHWSNKRGAPREDPEYIPGPLFFAPRPSAAPAFRCQPFCRKLERLWHKRTPFFRCFGRGKGEKKRDLLKKCKESDKMRGRYFDEKDFIFHVIQFIHFLVFFVVIFLAYYALPGKYRWILLLTASYYFYMCWKPIYAILLFATTALSYISALLVERNTARGRGGFKMDRPSFFGLLLCPPVLF